MNYETKYNQLSAKVLEYFDLIDKWRKSNKTDHVSLLKARNLGAEIKEFINPKPKQTTMEWLSQ